MDSKGLLKIAMSGEVGRELLRKLAYEAGMDKFDSQTQNTAAKEDKVLEEYKPKTPKVEYPKPGQLNPDLPAFKSYETKINLQAPALNSPLFAAAPPAGNRWLSGLGSPTQEA